MTTRRLTLREYQTAVGVELSAVERDTLQRLAPSIIIRPTVGREGTYDLTPSSVVGAITIGEIAVTVQPKLPIDRLLFLLSYSLDRHPLKPTIFEFSEADSLVEAIAASFVAQTRRALRRGVLQSYQTREESLQTVRGRILFDDQLRSRFGLAVPLEVRFDEFTEDIEENRLLRAALDRLRRMRVRSKKIANDLDFFDQVLGNVRLVQYDPRQLPNLHWTRLNERYRYAVALASLILRSTSFESGQGQTRASAFLVDMNSVFEDFVVRALRDALRLDERTFPQGAWGRRLRLDTSGRIVLRPDISWWDGSSCAFVGDIKYKRAGGSEVPNADLYQLLAYTVAADLPSGLLVYAAGEADPTRHTVVHLGKRLDIVMLDLTGNPSDILGEIQRLSERVRRHRRRARQDWPRRLLPRQEAGFQPRSADPASPVSG